MITAYFDNGRPHVSAHIEIPRLNITGTIPLLVDTGADNTCIHPKDGPELLIPYCAGPDGLSRLHGMSTAPARAVAITARPRPAR